ncbi:MAG: hypothetical protein IRZ21_07710 [Thermoleophilaceae bacterium]|nr:hypothetical protein [Thermoleophilaceae bacterium]
MADGRGTPPRPGEGWDSADVWSEARERVRAEVQAALGPRPRACPSCGHRAETTARHCPGCGSPYVVMARRGLSRRARRIAVAAAALAVVGVAIGAAALVPRIDDAKRRAREREAAQERAFVARETRRLRAEQAPRSGGAQLPRALSPSARRAAVVAALERSIGADARARVRAGAFKGPVLRTQCERVGYGPLARSPARGGYSCVAVTGSVTGRTGAQVGAIGYPFWAVVDFRRGTYTWCKVNPKAGERGVQSKEPVVPLSPRCRIHP